MPQKTIGVRKKWTKKLPSLPLSMRTYLMNGPLCPGEKWQISVKNGRKTSPVKILKSTGALGRDVFLAGNLYNLPA